MNDLSADSAGVAGRRERLFLHVLIARRLGRRAALPLSVAAMAAMAAIVIALLILVQLMKMLGDWLAVRSDKKDI